MVMCPNDLASSVQFIKDVPILSFLYVLNLELLLRKVGTLKNILRELGCGKSVSTYMDYVTVIVSS